MKVKYLHDLQYFGQQLQQHEANNAFTARILWADEARFTRDGVFNSHNSHMYLPPILMPSARRTSGPLVCKCGAIMLGNRLIGPYLLPERLTGHSYLIFIRDVLSDVLDDMPLAAIRGYGSSMTELWRISALLRVIGWILNTQATGLGVGVLFHGQHDPQI
ncbi:uncharacterized protein CEXT_611611 [Caerostris extrusa]|uniref:Transposase n=1 Tax=Caerostris extrusa TaxID=172846 RepID=A0AAV4MKG8_CAEEX|nr:uncharacterized protein CEXT_611611 [Caerostris extrusa]